MTNDEAEAVVELASARTLSERRNALTKVHRTMQRVSPSVRATMTTLVGEANDLRGSAIEMRQTAASIGGMPLVPHGPDPFMSPAAERLVNEWIACWSEAAVLMLRERGATPPGPMLIVGPPGTGKTTLTRAIARRLDPMPTYTLDGHATLGSHLGESGSKIANAFHAARHSGALVLEEIDGLGATRAGGGEASGQENVRITITLMRMLDEHGNQMPIVMTTNRLEALDGAFVRRCEYIVTLPYPDAHMRRDVVSRALGAMAPIEAIDLSLVEAVPIANRARRIAALKESDPAEVMRSLIKETTT